ncbi:amidohydrolase [Microbacterium sp. JZ31]|uniref:amidohydrolase n=1 Tax=Microbacterium sp. JZ31 TaxID=1906274 RepID=UPI0019343087|nr:amidohydrolase [Microbacterium sp. JZ31]
MRIDALYTNGRFRTLDPARPEATALGVLHGRVVGLDGDLDGVKADRVIDLGGRPVLPGFHDAHHHMSLTGARLAALDLRPGRIDDLDALYEAVRRRAAELPADAWVRGSGYDQNVLGGHPTAEALDRVAGGRPVLLEHVSAHMTVANTRAFELAGFPDRADVPDVAGGNIPRDDAGRPVGLLQENAMSLLYRVVRPIALEDLHHHLELASRQAVSYGLTSVVEPGSGDWRMIGNSPADFHGYQTAVEADRLQVRMTLMPYITTLHQLDGLPQTEWLGLDLGIRTGLGDDRLRVGPVKIASDGSFIGRSAAMHHCFHGEPDNNGVLLYDPELLTSYVVGAHKAGWTVAAHAIGDRAIDHVLDAFALAQREAPRPGVRHRIEHFALATDEHIRRTAELGVIPVPQGVFISDFGDGMAAAVEPELRDLIYRVKSLADAGIVLNGSTDSPVSDANPLVSIHDMVNRRTRSGALLAPAERITVAEAVRAYTVGSAYSVSQEHDKGTLEVGKLADFVTLSDDLFQVAPDRIREQQVTATFIGGRQVYGEE